MTPSLCLRSFLNAAKADLVSVADIIQIICLKRKIQLKINILDRFSFDIPALTGTQAAVERDERKGEVACSRCLSGSFAPALLFVEGC